MARLSDRLEVASHQENAGTFRLLAPLRANGDQSAARSGTLHTARRAGERRRVARGGGGDHRLVRLESRARRERLDANGGRTKAAAQCTRSEEHTSELQSPIDISYA